MADQKVGQEHIPGEWEWVEDPSPNSSSRPESQGTEQGQRQHSTDGPANAQSKKNWGPRTCRICLETVLPTFHAPSENLPGFLQGTGEVRYDSESGRLLRPCLCKGSARYVHENCLQEWRHADPSYGKRTYWSCPTCKFQYRLERLVWAHWVSSKPAQLALTFLILILTTFVLGFLADPIINLYLDPFGTIAYGSSEDFLDEDADWATHFVKGFASLGVLGFVKFFFTLSPFQWFNMRHFGGSGRSGNSGRDRIANINAIVIILGVVTFLIAVWKGVRALTHRVLKNAGERVMDVQGDDQGDADDDQT